MLVVCSLLLLLLQFIGSVIASEHDVDAQTCVQIHGKRPASASPARGVNWIPDLRELKTFIAPVPQRRMLARISIIFLLCALAPAGVGSFINLESCYMQRSIRLDLFDVLLSRDF